MIIANVVGKIWGADPIIVAPPYPLTNAAARHGPLSISSYQIVLITLTVVLVGLIELIYRTQYGKAVLAIAEDRDAALLRGIDPASLRRWSFALGGALTALIGYLAAPVLFASVSLGGLLLLKGFAVAAMGGLGSNRGALVAGYAIGLAEAVGIAYTTPAYHQAITLGLVLAVLLVRPGGLFGAHGVRTV
jgi:branched-chain amino acid transport system permease protein